MSVWAFMLLITLAWLSYPIAGASRVAVDVLEGKRPPDAGFSFLPEVLVGPVVLVGVAELLDHLVTPWGRRVVGAVCVAMIARHAYDILRAHRRVRRAEPPAR